MSVTKSVDKPTEGMTHAQFSLFWYSSAKVLGNNHGQSVNNKCMRMLLQCRDSIDGRDVDALGQGSRTYSMRARNGKRGNFLVRGIHCCHNYFCPTRVSILWRVCLYIHISDCRETVYALPLLPYNIARETFLHKPRVVRSVDWIFIIGTPAWRWLDVYVTLDKKCYNLLFKQEVVAAPVTCTFPSLSPSPKKPLLQI